MNVFFFFKSLVMSGDDSSHRENLKLQKPEDDQRNQKPLQPFPHIQVNSSKLLAYCYHCNFKRN